MPQDYGYDEVFGGSSEEPGDRPSESPTYFDDAPQGPQGDRALLPNQQHRVLHGGPDADGAGVTRMMMGQAPYPEPAAEPRRLEPPPPPPPVEPLSQSELMRMNRLMQGMSSAEDEVAKGNITAEEGEQYKQRIQEQLLPLQTRQQAAQQKAEADSIRKAMNQQALQSVMREHDQRYTALRVPQHVSHVHDPISGKVASFIVKPDGKVEQIDFSKDDSAEGTPDLETIRPNSGTTDDVPPLSLRNAVASSDPMAGVGQEGDEPPGRGKGPGDELPPPEESWQGKPRFRQQDQTEEDIGQGKGMNDLPGTGPVENPAEGKDYEPGEPPRETWAPEEDAQQRPLPPAQQAVQQARQQGRPVPIDTYGQAQRERQQQAAPREGHTMTIWNGGNRQEVQFDRSGRIVRPEGQAVGGLTVGQENEFRRRAEAHVPPVPPGLPPHVAQHLLQQRAEAVNHLFQNYLTLHARDHQHAQDEAAARQRQQELQTSRSEESQRHEKATSEENQRREGQRVEEAKRRESLMKRGLDPDARPLSNHEKSSLIHHYDKEVRDDPGFATKSEDERDAESHRRFQKHLQRLGLAPTTGQPAAQVAKEQADQFSGLLARVSGQQPAKPATRAYDLPPEVRNKQSSIGPEDVGHLEAALQPAWEKASLLSGDKSQIGHLMGRFELFRDRQKAAGEKDRPFTVAEREYFERVRNRISDPEIRALLTPGHETFKKFAATRGQGK